MRFEIHHHHHHHYPQLEEVLERLARMEKAQMSGASHMQTSLANLKGGVDLLREDVRKVGAGIADVGALIRQEAGSNTVLNDAANRVDEAVSSLGEFHAGLGNVNQAIADAEAAAAAAETPAPIEPPTPPAPPPAETPLPPEPTPPAPAEPETPATPDAPADGSTPPADPPA